MTYTESEELDPDVLKKAIEYLKVKPSSTVMHVSPGTPFVFDKRVLFVHDDKLIGQSFRNEEDEWNLMFFKTPFEMDSI